MLISLHELIAKYKIAPVGVVHIGASTGQEAGDYFNAGMRNTFWVEAIPDVFKKLQDHVHKINFDSAICINALLSDVDGEEIKFNIASNEGQSSSMFEFGTHSKMHPTVKFTGSIQLQTTRFDTLVKVESDFNYYPELYDFLNIDVQGAELKVLRGMGDLLHHFKYAYIEVNEDYLYKGCPLVQDIDKYLSGFGFQRVETKMTGWKWGDAFYIKK